MFVRFSWIYQEHPKASMLVLPYRWQPCACAGQALAPTHFSCGQLTVHKADRPKRHIVITFITRSVWIWYGKYRFMRAPSVVMGDVEKITRVNIYICYFYKRSLYTLVFFISCDLILISLTIFVLSRVPDENFFFSSAWKIEFGCLMK